VIVLIVVSFVVNSYSLHTEKEGAASFSRADLIVVTAAGNEASNLPVQPDCTIILFFYLSVVRYCHPNYRCMEEHTLIRLLLCSRQ